jgi:hypothetical protein
MPEFDPTNLDQMRQMMGGGGKPPGEPPYRGRPEPSEQPPRKPSIQPDNQVKQARIEAEMSRSSIERGHRQGAITLAEWAAILELLKYSGYAIAIADGVFSFWALSVAFNNRWMALVLSYGIGAMLFIFGVLISIKGIDDFFKMDKDNSGRISRSEFFWWIVKVLSAGIIVTYDVATNYFGITEITARSLLPAEVVPGWAVSLFASCLLMVLGHLIISGCDVALRKIASSYASAEKERFESQAKKDAVSAWGEEVVMGAREQGSREGKGFKIKLW